MNGRQPVTFAIGEVPAVRQLIELAANLFAGADGWGVFAVVPGRRRRHLVETFDSRYAAEQGLKRWNQLAEEQSSEELDRTIAEAGRRGIGWVRRTR